MIQTVQEDREKREPGGSSQHSVRETERDDPTEKRKTCRLVWKGNMCSPHSTERALHLQVNHVNQNEDGMEKLVKQAFPFQEGKAGELA